MFLGTIPLLPVSQRRPPRDVSSSILITPFRNHRELHQMERKISGLQCKLCLPEKKHFSKKAAVAGEGDCGPHTQLLPLWQLKTDGVLLSCGVFVCLFDLTGLLFSLDSLKSTRWSDEAHPAPPPSRLAETPPTVEKAVKIPIKEDGHLPSPARSPFKWL